MTDESAKRRHLRLDLEVPVRISTIDPETDPQTGRPYFRATREVAGNLSRGGLFLRTHDPLAPGRRVLVEMHFPDGRPLEMVGRVAWSRSVLSPNGIPEENGAGVEFVGGAPEHLTTLEDFLRTEASEE